VGQCGLLQLRPGWYLYVGSAFGPGGLAARVGRHLMLGKKPRWHIDYVRQYLEITAVWFNAETRQLEHEWAGYFLRHEACSVPLPGFGASDCRCETHFFYSNRQPDWNAFGEFFSEYERCRYLA
jgi:Uri superfamily endonuclease